MQNLITNHFTFFIDWSKKIIWAFVIMPKKKNVHTSKACTKPSVSNFLAVYLYFTWFLEDKRMALWWFYILNSKLLIICKICPRLYSIIGSGRLNSMFLKLVTTGYIGIDQPLILDTEKSGTKKYLVCLHFDTILGFV